MRFVLWHVAELTPKMCAGFVGASFFGGASRAGAMQRSKVMMGLRGNDKKDKSLSGEMQASEVSLSTPSFIWQSS